MVKISKHSIIYISLCILFIFSIVLYSFFQLNIPYSSHAFLEYQVVPVYSKIDGVVEKLYVKDGDIVKLNQPLFKLDDSIYNSSYISAKGEYFSAIENIKNLKNDIKNYKKIVKDSNEIYAREYDEYLKYQQLYKKHYISLVELNNAKINLLETQKKLTENSNKLENLKNKYKPNEKTIPEFLKAEGNYKRALLNLNYTTILSPISGEVVLNNFYPNTNIKSNSILFYIKNSDILKVQVDINEKSISDNFKNRTALILFDGIPGKIFKGKVNKINQLLKDGFYSSNSLVNINEDNSWIRNTGKIRTTVIIENSTTIKKLPSGSKASVIFLSKNNNIFYNFLAKIWINIIMVMNYVY